MKSFRIFLLEEDKTDHHASVAHAAAAHHLASHADKNTRRGNRSRRTNSATRAEARRRYKKSGSMLSKKDRHKAVRVGIQAAKDHIQNSSRIAHVTFHADGSPQTHHK